MRLRHWIGFLIAGIVIVMMSAYQYWTSLGSGDLAPAFTLSELDGGEIALEDHRGKLVLLHFWATWCEVCREEVAGLEGLHQRLGGSGLVILSVSEDQGNAERLIRRFKKFYPFTYPVLLDSDGAVASLYQAWGVPETFIIGPDGMILKKLIGPQRWDDPEVIERFEKMIVGRPDEIKSVH